MKKVKSLNSLRRLLTGLLTDASQLKRCGEWSYAKGCEDWKVPDSEPCVICFGDELTASWRRRKPLGSVEVFRLTRVDREDGPTCTRSNYYLVKLAKFLDKKGLYEHREVISTETDNLF